MDAQTLINIAIALVGTLGGWVLNSLKTSIADIHKGHLALADKVQAIEVLVAGKYVTKDDLERLVTALFTKLDKMDEKLDRKVDK